MKPGRARGLRHQLPAYSPLPFPALVRGARSLPPLGRDPRPDLLRLLLTRTGAEAGTLTDSGTSALRLALERMKALGRVPVALPAFTCFDVATAALGAEVPVTLYDIDPGNLSPDLGSLEAALEDGARSVVVTPLYGLPVDWEGIRDRTNPSEVVVIEDAAQAHGSRFRGSPWGSHGDLVVLSFGRGKGWSGGGGGALLVRARTDRDVPGETEPLPDRGPLRELRHLAESAALWLLARPGLYRAPRSIPALGLGETRFREPHRVRKMTRAGAGIALGSVAAADAEIESRRIAAAAYASALGVEGEKVRADQKIGPVPGGESGWLRFPLLVPEEEDPEEFLIAGARRLGVERSYPHGLSQLPTLRQRLPHHPPDHPGARVLGERLITLPTHSRAGPRDRENLTTLLLQWAHDREWPRSCNA